MGATVTMKSSPMYQPGAIGNNTNPTYSYCVLIYPKMYCIANWHMLNLFNQISHTRNLTTCALSILSIHHSLYCLCAGFTISCGVPKVGILQYAAWNLSDSGRFKLLPAPVQDRQDFKDKREQQVTLHY